MKRDHALVKYAVKSNYISIFHEFLVYLAICTKILLADIDITYWKYTNISISALQLVIVSWFSNTNHNFCCTKWCKRVADIFSCLLSTGQKPRVKGERIIIVEVEADDTARLKPRLQSFKKKWKVFWYKNNTLIRNRRNRKKYRFKNLLLRIKHVSKDDAGLYKCVIKNKFGSASQLFNLTVGGECEEDKVPNH